MDPIKVGDYIRTGGADYRVTFIWSQACNGGWDVEFSDQNNQYRHWKQYEDGGSVLRT